MGFKGFCFEDEMSVSFAFGEFGMVVVDFLCCKTDLGHVIRCMFNLNLKEFVLFCFVLGILLE